jgi:hypothetical protein
MKFFILILTYSILSFAQGTSTSGGEQNFTGKSVKCKNLLKAFVQIQTKVTDQLDNKKEYGFEKLLDEIYQKRVINTLDNLDPAKDLKKLCDCDIPKDALEEVLIYMNSNTRALKRCLKYKKRKVLLKKLRFILGKDSL